MINLCYISGKINMEIDQYINDGQDPKVVEKLLLKLQDMLASTEEITYIAVQKKPAVTFFPNSIAISNKRVFICKSTKLGLATDFDILSWRAIENISFKEGILGAQVAFTQHDSGNITMAYIPKTQARKLYQAGMEAIGAQPSNEAADGTDTPAQLQVAEPNDELALKLEKLKSLFERELITETEYENKKNELLSQL